MVKFLRIVYICKQFKTIQEIWLAKLTIKIMPFEHQHQQFKKYNNYTHFTYEQFSL